MRVKNAKVESSLNVYKNTHVFPNRPLETSLDERPSLEMSDFACIVFIVKDPTVLCACNSITNTSNVISKLDY